MLQCSPYVTVQSVCYSAVCMLQCSTICSLYFVMFSFMKVEVHKFKVNFSGIILFAKHMTYVLQVSNLNLYRLGRRKVFGESMIATKFEPHDNWLPPCYYVPRELEQALIEAGVPASHWNQADLPGLRDLSRDEICKLVRERSEKLHKMSVGENDLIEDMPTACGLYTNIENLPCFIPYNLITQHSIPDKSVADCVEALIGAYLIACGPRGALLFMAWLGICVLPKEEVGLTASCSDSRPVGSLVPELVIKDENSMASVERKQVCN